MFSFFKISSNAKALFTASVSILRRLSECRQHFLAGIQRIPKHPPELVVMRRQGVDTLVGTAQKAVLMAHNGIARLYFRVARLRCDRSVWHARPDRRAAWEATRITVFGAMDFAIASMTIEGSAAAGIQTAQGAGGDLIAEKPIRDTLSDAIHLTDGAHNIRVERNLISRAGEDGIAVVSYVEEAPVIGIVAGDNIIADNLWGRLMSIVGGRDILHENNSMTGNLARFACIYVAQEDVWQAQTAHDVTIRNNTMADCGGTDTGHAAVMIYAEGTLPNIDVTVTRNLSRTTEATGIRVTEGNVGIQLQGNQISGAELAYDISSSDVSLAP